MSRSTPVSSRRKLAKTIDTLQLATANAKIENL